MSRPSKPPKLIVCAANRHRVTGMIVCGARHFDDRMRAVMEETGGFPFWLNCDQGFIDQFGKWHTRKEAMRIARKMGQIRNPNDVSPNTLFSEDLY